MLLARSTDGSLAYSLLRPQFRWSTNTMRYADESKKRREVGVVAGARPAVQAAGELPVGVASDLPVDEIPIAHVQQPVRVRLERRIELGHRSM